MATEQEIIERFKGVENSPPPTEGQQDAVKRIRALVVELALEINQSSIHQRYAATALTELETAAMFAVKGVFQK